MSVKHSWRAGINSPGIRHCQRLLGILCFISGVTSSSFVMIRSWNTRLIGKNIYMKGQNLIFHSTLLHTWIVRWVPALPLTLLKRIPLQQQKNHTGIPLAFSSTHHLHQERMDYFIVWFCIRSSSSVGCQSKEDQTCTKLPLCFRLYSCIIPYSLSHWYNFCQPGR